MSFTAQLPLNKTRNGTYVNIENEVDLVKQNVRNVLLTNPGERIMLPEFGAGLKRFLFENQLEEEVKSLIIERIEVQFEKYLPTVELENVYVESVENALIVKVFYNLFNFNIQDFVQIAVTN
tara:strand:+ start:172 stop:537 length:366 start_codon:yes stop_codon:yes gene_type:complete